MRIVIAAGEFGRCRVLPTSSSRHSKPTSCQFFNLSATWRNRSMMITAFFRASCSAVLALTKRSSRSLMSLPFIVGRAVLKPPSLGRRCQFCNYPIIPIDIYLSTGIVRETGGCNHETPATTRLSESCDTTNRKAPLSAGQGIGRLSAGHLPFCEWRTRHSPRDCGQTCSSPGLAFRVDRPTKTPGDRGTSNIIHHTGDRGTSMAYQELKQRGALRSNLLFFYAPLTAPFLRKCSREIAYHSTKTAGNHLRRKPFAAESALLLTWQPILAIGTRFIFCFKHGSVLREGIKRRIKEAGIFILVMGMTCKDGRGRRLDSSPNRLA